MNRQFRWLGIALILLFAPLVALAQVFGQPGPSPSAPAQPPGPTAGIEFQLATEFLSPNDSRVEGGGNLFKLTFRTDPGGTLYMFYERITETFSFKNGGPAAGGATSVPVAPGESSIDGVGVGLTFGATRLEIMTGRATTTVTSQGAASTSLASSDPVVDIGFFWAYRPAVSRALIDLGLVYRQQKLSGALPGNTIVTTSTQSKQFSDMGGLIARLGIGYAF